MTVYFVVKEHEWPCVQYGWATLAKRLTRPLTIPEFIRSEELDVHVAGLGSYLEDMNSRFEISRSVQLD